MTTWSEFEDLYFDLMYQVDDRSSGSHALSLSRQKKQGDHSEIAKTHNFQLVKLKSLEIPTFTRKFDN